MFKTFTIWTLILIFAASGTWYFLIKEFEYTITFRSKTEPGTAFFEVLNRKYSNWENVKVERAEEFSEIVQQAKISNSTKRISWDFSTINDSVTEVTAKINDVQQPIRARIKNLFGEVKAQELIEEELKNLRDQLNLNSTFYRIKILGKTNSPAATCACISAHSNVEEKAFAMIENIEFLSAYVLENDLQTSGRPRIDVTNWNLKSNRITFDFCFPLAESTNYPTTGNIFIKHIPSQEAVKAIFNGNYAVSHTAWWKLLNYAEENNIEVTPQPLEIFLNNPEMGGNSKNWEAEIYMPIQQ